MLMIQNPITTLKTMSFVMGWVVLVAGVSAVVFSLFVKENDVYESKRSDLIDGILLLILGLIFTFGNFINNTLFLAYLLIFWIIIDSALQLQLSILIRKKGLRIAVVVLDILIISYSVWLLFNPAGAESFLVLYAGFGFISTGVSKFIKGF